MNTKDIDVLFFVEHIDREMKGTLKVKQLLENNYGLSVHVASIGFGLYESWRKYSPKVICLPYCRSDKSVMVRLFKTRNPNTVCINLNYEQLLSPATEIYKKPQGEFANKELVQFVWGKHFKRYLINCGVDENLIHIVGKPEIQFLLEMKNSDGVSLRKDISIKEDLDINKKWVFIPFNDGTALWDDKHMMTMSKRGGVSFNDLKDISLCTKEQLNLFFKWVSVVAKEYQDIEFIYRPHPGVNINDFSSYIKNNELDARSNFHIIRSYTIKEWLCCSQICITNWSTTIVDSALLGLKSFIFKPSLLPPGLSCSWLKGFTPIESLEELKKAISNLLIDENINVERYEDYIDTSEGAVSMWAASIAQCVNNYTENNNRYPVKAFFKEWKQLLRSEFRRVMRIIGLKKLVNNRINYDYFEML